MPSYLYPLLPKLHARVTSEVVLAKLSGNFSRASLNSLAGHILDTRRHRLIDLLAACRDGLPHHQEEMTMDCGGTYSGGYAALRKAIERGWLARTPGRSLGYGRGTQRWTYTLTEAGRAYLNGWLTERHLPICP